VAIPAGNLNKQEEIMRSKALLWSMAMKEFRPESTTILAVT